MNPIKKMYKKICVKLLMLGVFLFCGCEPDETFVLVKTSELKKAIDGELGFATIEMVFDVYSSNDPSLPNRVRSAVLPYLGDEAFVEIQKKIVKTTTTTDVGSIREVKEEEESSTESLDDAKFVARFKIPIGTKEALEDVYYDVMRLEYNQNKKMFMLVPGKRVRDLNRDLDEIKWGLKFEYTGGYRGGFDPGTTIKITGNDSLKITVCAVEIGKKRVILDSYNSSNGSLSINYNNPFYNGYAPCFIVGEFQGEIVPKKLKE